MKIIQAEKKHMDSVRDLFREYQAWLDADVCFQGFEEELASLPGDYQSPQGTILIALEANHAVACSALKPLTQGNEAELKRLYVQDALRGQGLGKKIFQQTMQAAKTIGYDAVVLETLPDKMKAAQFLYRDFGFLPMPNYTNNAEQGVECFRYSFKDNA